jgi:thymidylate kinase
VVEAYRALSARFPERYVMIDGRRDVTEVAAEIRDHVR